MAKIFLSYRRDDSAGYAGRLYDRLRNRFGRQQVFMDVNAIEVGEDFAHVIEEKIGSCDVLVVLIGKQWLSSTDNEGRRRLENQEDFVRLEIAAALDRNILVIPTLVGGASMPSVQKLPPVLKHWCPN